MGEVADELWAGVLVGVAIAICFACLAIASGGVSTSAVIRVVRRLAPRDRRAASRDGYSTAFDCYYHRQRELELHFSQRLDDQRRVHRDSELVVGVHAWELPIILAMPQVQDGKLYGEYELVRWTHEDCDIVPLHDPRIVTGQARGIHNGGNGGNGALPTL